MLKIAIFAFIAVASAQVPDSRCPPGTPDPPVHLPDTSDCTRFFTCVGGNAWPQICPPGQHFDARNNRCDWPELAGCANTPQCPPTNPPWPQEPPMFPHPEDCTRFFKCNWGVAHELSCPPPQHFAPHLNRCDWPDVAQCTAGPRTTTTSTSTQATTTRTTASTSTARTTTERTTRRSIRFESHEDPEFY